ncbi:N-6 DNA methylase [Streptomyces sp. NPDC059378]|uniref:N-6 DNA methylase n=1 Tax=Streptomyces sp. NPDC059378 TaxID=3346815 RepID=UPI0036A56ACC
MDQLDLFDDAADAKVPPPATFAARPKLSRPVTAPSAPRPTPAPASAPRPALTPRPVVAADEELDGLFSDFRPELPAIQTPIPMPRRIAPALIGSPRDAGQRLGEAVAETWHASNWGGYRIDIPISIVGGLALYPIKGYTEDITRIISNCTDWELLQGYREIYVEAWKHRPDLAVRMAPLLKWLSEDGVEEKAYAARRVTDTALRYGILQLTGDPDPFCRSDTDVMSWTITSLRSHGARQGLGEYHTPPDVCDLMAEMLVGGEPPQKGQRFHEPAGGTGGMFRALAQQLRHMQADPADYVWVLNELDPLAAAGAAVNAIVWGLGPNTVIACGNTLAERDLLQRALRERQGAFEERDEILGRFEVTEAVQQALTLADRLIRGEWAH